MDLTQPARRGISATPPAPTPEVTVIVPLYNSGDTIEASLRALAASTFTSHEVIVMDDCSTDDGPDRCRALGARVIPMPMNSGPAAARNFGARHARGRILVFVDADVVVHADSLARFVQILGEGSPYAAAFGSYDDRPTHAGWVSQYKNLLHHFVHQRSREEATTFWAGCGAVRRDVFLEIGGFDFTKYARPAIEDIEFGHRLVRAGHRIRLDKNVQCTHLKRWTLQSLVMTDVRSRAVPWTELALDSQDLPEDLNLRPAHRISAGLVGLFVLCTLAGFVAPAMLLALPVIAGVLAYLNRDLFGFFRARLGWAFLAAAIPLHSLYYFYSGATFCFVWARRGLVRLAPRG